MKRAKVVFLPAAAEDVTEIWTYIKDTLHNEPAARNITTKIVRRTQLLEGLPEMGLDLGVVDAQLKGHRYVLVDNYIVIYKITDKVQIVRVLYARSNYVQLLNEH